MAYSAQSPTGRLDEQNPSSLDTSVSRYAAECWRDFPRRPDGWLDWSQINYTDSHLDQWSKDLNDLAKSQCGDNVFNPLSYLGHLPAGIDHDAIVEGLLAGFGGDYFKLITFLDCVDDIPEHELYAMRSPALVAIRHSPLSSSGIANTPSPQASYMASPRASHAGSLRADHLASPRSNHPVSPRANYLASPRANPLSPQSIPRSPHLAGYNSPHSLPPSPFDRPRQVSAHPERIPMTADMSNMYATASTPSSVSSPYAYDASILKGEVSSSARTPDRRGRVRKLF